MGLRPTKGDEDAPGRSVPTRAVVVVHCAEALTARKKPTLLDQNARSLPSRPFHGVFPGAIP